MLQRFAVAVTGLLILPLAACGQSTTGGEVAPPAVASGSAPTSAPPSAAPVSPDDDYQALARTVLTDVGNGWKKQGEVSDDTPSHRKDQSPRAAVEYCPGHVSEAFKVDRFAAAASQRYTKRVTQSVDDVKTTIDATLYLATSALPSVTDATELKAAYAQDLEACRDYKVNDQTYIVMTPEGVTSTPSADEVITSFSVLRYSDQAHKKLQTIGQYAYVRTGRVIASVVINTLPAKENDRGRDFAEVGTLVEKQLAATKAALPA